MTVNLKGEGAACLGLLMLDTQFPRPWGDIGNPKTFAVSVKTHVVTQAVPTTVVRSASGLAGSSLAARFSDAAHDLASCGVWAITSSCGFLVLLQETIQLAVPHVPVRSSSLLQLPSLLAQHEEVGVLTISAEALGPEHLLAAGVPTHRLQDILVQGVAPESEFVQKIMGNQLSMDVCEAQGNVVAAAVALKRKAPSLKHLVLECTNMPPYQQAIEAATGFTCWTLRDDPVLSRLAMKHCRSPLVGQVHHARL